MPAAVEGAASKTAGKRKRQENGDASKKRRRSEAGDDNESRTSIATLEAEIQESRKHYNNIATLIDLAQKHEQDPRNALAASEALCRTFIRLLAAGSLIKRKDVSEKDATVIGWLRDRLADYRGTLLSMFGSKKLALNALTLAMALLKAEAQHLNDRAETVFPRYFFLDIVSSILESPVEELRDHFAEKFINEYHDMRFYTFESIK